MSTQTKAYTLVGVNGNAISIMGYTVRAMRDAKRPKADIDAFTAAAFAGDYNNVISTSMDILSAINADLGLDEYESEDYDDDDYDEDEE
jgi:hypothetical protein